MFYCQESDDEDEATEESQKYSIDIAFSFRHWLNVAITHKSKLCSDLLRSHYTADTVCFYHKKGNCY